MKSMFSVTCALFIFSATAAFAQRTELNVIGGFLSARATEPIQNSGRTLMYDNAPAAGLGLNVHWTRQISTEVGGVMATPRLKLRTLDGTENGRRIRFGQPDALLKFSFANRSGVEPYVGAGVMYMTFRRSVQDLNAGSATITRISQPDHVALLLDSGVFLQSSRHFGFVVDARYGPAQSTAEVRETDAPHSTRQANFHPLVVGAGVSYRF